MIPLTATGRYLTVGQAATLLGVDPKTLGKWSRDNRIPCIRTAGGHRRYLKSDVEAALAGFNVAPAQQGGAKKETTTGGAMINLGTSWSYRLHGEPRTDGERLVLGRSSSGHDVVVTIRSAEWLDALEAAVRALRGENRCGTCGYTTARCVCPSS
jgi:excisionase family DNA binding protein